MGKLAASPTGAAGSVPVEATANRQAAFEVDQRPFYPLAKSAAPQGFFDGGDSVAVVVDCNDRETNAVMAQALVNFQLV